MRGILGKNRRQKDCRQRDAASAQALAKCFPASFQLSAQTADANAQLLGGLVARQTIEVAEDQGSTPVLRQALQFLVQGGPRFTLTEFSGGVDGGYPPSTFPPTPSDTLPLQVEGDAGGDSVEPTAERRGLADGGSGLGQNQEGSLARVLGVVDVSQCAQTDALDHRPVALDQDRERGLLLAFDEAPNQFAVAQLPICLPGCEAANALEQRAECLLGHVPSSFCSKQARLCKDSNRSGGFGARFSSTTWGAARRQLAQAVTERGGTGQSDCSEGPMVERTAQGDAGKWLVPHPVRSAWL